MGLIIDHNTEKYRKRWEKSGSNKWNGAYYYSKEIVQNIIPRIKTSRNWVTVNQPGQCFDHAVVFIHNNKFPQTYAWLKDYKDLVLVVGAPQTVEKMAYLNQPIIYLPLSVDVANVEKYKRPKTKENAFVGRPEKLLNVELPIGLEVLSELPREALLPQMAEFKKVYAVGRCAIEARILGCDIGVYDPRYPDADLWQVIDNKDAAKMLQKELDKIDKGGK